MNHKLLQLQLLGCALLSGILFAEWGYGQFAQKELRATLDRHIDSDYQAEELPSLDMARQAAQSFNHIVERPLFIEGRKPLPESSQGDTAQAPEVGQIDDWQLIGIYERDHRLYALFSKQNEARKFLKLNQEQIIAGWQLHEIQSDRVVLQQGGQQKSVMLRKPRAKNQPNTPTAKPAAGKPAKPVKPVAATNNNPPRD